MNALVDPFPLVPAMCIQFSRLKSDGWATLSRSPKLAVAGDAHLVARSLAPFYHLWYCLFVHATARLPYCIDDREIGL